MPQPATVRRTRSAAPVGPRRVSGPSRRALPAGAAIPRGRTGPFERLSRIPDHRMVDRLLRGRACILVIGIMLGGIVAMQVSLLRLNAGISRAVQTQSTLELQNATLQSSIAELTSSERVREAAVGLSMVDPPAGDTRYLHSRPTSDPKRALRVMRPPSEQARAVMINGGVEPNPVAPLQVAAAAPVVTAPPVTETPPVTTAPPATTTEPATAAATPVPTPVAPVVDAAPPVTTDPGTGAATAG